MEALKVLAVMYGAGAVLVGLAFHAMYKERKERETV